MNFCWNPSVRAQGVAEATNELPYINPELVGAVRYGSRDIPIPVSFNNLPTVLNESKQLRAVLFAYGVDNYDTLLKEGAPVTKITLCYKDMGLSAEAPVRHAARINDTIERLTRSNRSNTATYTSVYIIHTRASNLAATHALFAELDPSPFANLCASVKLSNNHDVVIYQRAFTWFVVTNFIGPGLFLRLLAVLGHMIPALKFKDEEYLRFLIADNLTGFMGKLSDFFTHFNKHKNRREIEKTLKLITDNALANLIYKAENAVTSKTSALEMLYTNARDTEAALIEAQKTLFYTIHMQETMDNPLLNLTKYILMKHEIKKVIVNNGSSTNFTLIYSLPCSIFDPKAVAVLLKNKSLRDFTEPMRAAFTKIFIEQEHYLWLTAGVVIDIENNTVNKTREYLSEEGVPNPHLFHHTCFGNNTNHIIRALRSQSYEVAIEQVTSAVRGINFYDGTVASEFLRNLKNLPEWEFATYKQKCISLNAEDEGPTLTWMEYLAYLVPPVEVEPIILNPELEAF